MSERVCCDCCGSESAEIREEHPGIHMGRLGVVERTLTCEDCFTGADTGPCFDDLMIVQTRSPQGEDRG